MIADRFAMPPRRRRPATRWCALLVLLALLPGSLHARPLDPGEVAYAAAMRPAFAADVARPQLPRYHVRLAVDPAAGRLSGELELLFWNTTGAALPDVVLRLYQNFPQDVFGDGGDGAAALSDARVDGKPVEPRYQAGHTAVRLALARPIEPGAAAQISLSWTAHAGPLHGTDDTIPLLGAIPQLAVWDGGWRTDVTRMPDHVYAESGLYHAFVSAPAEWAVASGGAEIGRTTRGATATTELVSGPVRELALALGRFSSIEADSGGVTLRVAYRRDGKVPLAAAQQVLRRAVQSLATTAERYGPYPYRALTFCVLEAGRGFSDAREHPGFILLLLDRGYSPTTHQDVAHEVGHQWFYGLVGNDIYRDPWLDEALAQYTTFVVMQQWDGAAAADDYFASEIAALGGRARYSLGRSVDRYPSWGSLYASVYGKGGLFIAALRERVGDDAFFAGLRRYVERHRYGVAHPDDLRRALESASGQDLGELFASSLGGR